MEIAIAFTQTLYMDLHSGELYWYKKDGMINSYHSLDKDIKTDVLIIGTGISGALAAYHLVNHGLKITLIDSRDAASGSTAASTCLLQYEIDTPLKKLIEKVGKKNAVKSYLLCRDAIKKIKIIADKIKSHSEFENRKSIYIASNIKDAESFDGEFNLRNESGIELRLLNRDELFNKYNIKSPAALVSNDGAQINAYRFTHDLLRWLSKKGVNIFDKTEAIKRTYKKNNVNIVTDKKNIITASHVIFANGYEAQNFLKEPYGRLHSTYVVTSEPLKSKPFNYILWESARPYTYVRLTSDNRIIVGGKDEVFYSPGKRDKLLTLKSKQLVKSFNKIYPDINFLPDYSWTGTFAETIDGLPYIGKHKDHPHCYFSLCYGGNGITFSLIAAELIRDEILRKKNEDKKIFSFNRKNNS